MLPMMYEEEFEVDRENLLIHRNDSMNLYRITMMKVIGWQDEEFVCRLVEMNSLS